MTIQYTTWHSEEDAKKAEAFLAEKLIEAQGLTPTRRERFYDHTFYEFRQMMGIEHGEKNSLVVYTNINPMLALIKAGRGDIVLKAYKDNLPLCGDGYVKAEKPAHKALASRQYFVSTTKLPVSEDSLFYRGIDSPFFSLETNKDVTTLAKCYRGNYCFDAEYVERCVIQLSSPSANLDNVLMLYNRAIDGSKFVETSKRLSGLSALVDSEYGPSSEAIIQFAQVVKGDETRMKHAMLLFSYLNEPVSRTSAIADICGIKPFKYPDADPIKRFVENVVVLDKVFSQICPAQAKGFRIKLLKESAQFNFGYEENMKLRDEFMAKYSQADILADVTARDVDFFVKRFGYTGLMEKASSEYKAKKLDDALGL